MIINVFSASFKNIHCFNLWVYSLYKYVILTYKEGPRAEHGLECQVHLKYLSLPSVKKTNKQTNLFAFL